MTFILLIGVLGVLVVMLLKRPILGRLGGDNNLVDYLGKAKWFHNYWLAGIFLFIMNTALFLITGFILYLLTLFLIPFVHLFVMLLAVIGSILIWLLINKAWRGTRSNRLKMGLIGSSFYFFLTIIFIYKLVTLKPAYPGEDTFMAAIGLIFAIVVAAVAFTACFAFTGFSKKEENM
ncbi:hypothetical protein [Scopulibacillus darangshiensis]|uniref:hypothetical protein n=1 Tax=Scopulibacillus darangshiensis TaxID=442528 RepID=UPI001FB1CAC4|nr:hypothetical protein [Scopulibacillus darangshiensis]